AQMMLDHLVEHDASKVLMDAIEHNIKAGKVRTKDLGGTASTQEVTTDIINIISSM
ncbi:MAG: hypothetical protein HRU40_12245, partial [Saprospiraceae bacterium]|nr:hypothetical protein [Saprospiraceae bacterium]